MHPRNALSAILLCLTLSACGGGENRLVSDEVPVTAPRVSVHRDGDDLLSAGLGLAGLRKTLPPPVSDAHAPTAAELRRRAIHANWRGIADLVGEKGLGDLSSALPSVPGREWSGFANLPGRQHPHRVLVQVPDNFNAPQRCLVVTASSGSRGIYGAIALAGAWGLPKGCAVAYTDKGAGTGFFDVDGREGVALDGTRSDGGVVEFRPAWPEDAAIPPHRIALKHAHSADNPEADWGRHVLQAAHFGLQVLNDAFPAQAPFTRDNTRIIAVGLSNAGGAVLRAAELDGQGMFDAVVAVAPNILAPSRGRALFDYATEAALFSPCAMPAIANAVTMMPPAARDAVAKQRCASLQQAGLLQSTNAAAQAQEALDHLLAQGWSRPALALYQQGVVFDLWRAVAVTYAHSYARVGVHAPLCGFGFAMLDAEGRARASTVAERALWGADSSGIAPTVGIGMVDTLAAGPDPAFPGLMCLRSLWQGAGLNAKAVQLGIAEIRGTARPLSAHVHVVHGVDDGLIPIDFTSRAYVQDARDLRHHIEFTEVPDAQHFDAFVSLPMMTRYQPLLPHAYKALDEALLAVLAKH